MHPVGARARCKVIAFARAGRDRSRIAGIGHSILVRSRCLAVPVHNQRLVDLVGESDLEALLWIQRESGSSIGTDQAEYGGRLAVDFDTAPDSAEQRSRFRSRR